VAIFFLATAQDWSLATWFDSWNHWDSYWYQFTWENEFPQDDPRNLVYAPGFAVLTGGLSKLLGSDFQRTALVFNCLSFWATAILFCELVARRFALPYRSILMLCFLSSPVSYFCFPAYSDPFFNLMAWTLIGLSLMDQEKLGESQRILIRLAQPTLAFVMPWFRFTGYAFLSWLVLRKWFVLTALVTLSLWLTLNRAITGDPFYFLNTLELFDMRPGGFLVGFTSTIQRIVSGPKGPTLELWQLWLGNDLLAMVYLLALTATALWLFWKKEFLLAITTLAILALSHNGSYWRSTLRYDWPLIPLLFVPLLSWAVQGRTRRLKTAAWVAIVFLLGIQFALQICYARAFLEGRWAF
jgi:hypothetical protein